MIPGLKPRLGADATRPEGRYYVFQDVPRSAEPRRPEEVL
jgi:hypothetical protein